MPFLDFEELRFTERRKKAVTGKALVGVKKTHRAVGAGRMDRVRYFSKYMPLRAARRMAKAFNITRGSKAYNPGVIKGLRVVNKEIKDAMRLNKCTRDQAIRIVWGNIAAEFRQAGFKIETASDLLHNWLNDWTESP